MNELLEELVPRRDERADWEDVLRRSRRRAPRRRLVLAAALALGALGGGPALGVLLLRDTGPRLPGAADRNNVVVIVQPLTGRVLVEAARWKGHDGVCYLLLGTRAGCVPRTQRSTLVVTPPVAGYTFDERVVSGDEVLVSGTRVPLRVEHFEKLQVTFFLQRDRVPRRLRAVELKDAAGHVVKRYRLKR